MELKIKESKLGQVVSARELYHFMQVKSNFWDWINRRIDKYNFKQNEDFITLTQKKVTAQKNVVEEKEYLITLDMAKELSMIENNEKGRMARKYFISCEREYKRLLEDQIKFLQEQNKQLLGSLEWDSVKGSNTSIKYCEKSISEEIQEIEKSLRRLKDNSMHIALYSNQIERMTKRIENGQLIDKKILEEDDSKNKKGNNLAIQFKPSK